MPIARAAMSSVCAALLAAAVLTGCMGNRLSADAPAVRLQGIWKLNRSASDDPEKIITALRAEADKKMKRAIAQQQAAIGSGGGMGPPGGGGRGRGGRQGGGDEPDDLAMGPPGGPGAGMDSLRNSPTMHAFREVLQRSDYLTIRQSADQVSFDYGTSRRSYTPGARSVVSSENGVADQTSGWDGKQYVVRIKPQLGPAIVEEYGLSPDGKQLVVKTHIGPWELQKVNLTRVYDATGAVVPYSGPTND